MKKRGKGKKRRRRELNKTMDNLGRRREWNWQSANGRLEELPRFHPSKLSSRSLSSVALGDRLKCCQWGEIGGASSSAATPFPKHARASYLETKLYDDISLLRWFRDTFRPKYKKKKKKKKKKHFATGESCAKKKLNNNNNNDNNKRVRDRLKTKVLFKDAIHWPWTLSLLDKIPK